MNADRVKAKMEVSELEKSNYEVELAETLLKNLTTEPEREKILSGHSWGKKKYIIGKGYRIKKIMNRLERAIKKKDIPKAEKLMIVLNKKYLSFVDLMYNSEISKKQF
jgi:hypothetical protein